MVGLVALAAMAAACRSPVVPLRVAEPDIPVLAAVRNWAIQLQGLGDEAAVHRLEVTPVDLLVIEPVRSQQGHADFATAALVRRLQQSPGATTPRKRCLAYLNLGQAEDYRGYWQPDWRAPTTTREGQPSFLLGVDPDGWQGNYPVAYWRPEWRRCLFGAPDAPLDQILADGFDGVYLDWILACQDPQVTAAAAKDGVDPVAAMVELLAALRGYARSRYPLFQVVAQNGLELVERAPSALDSIDALAQEDVCFRGQAGAAWHDALAGDLPAPDAGAWSTARLCARLAEVARRGVPVFTLDYALRTDHAALAERTSRAHGFVPYVARTPLDRLAPPAAP